MKKDTAYNCTARGRRKHRFLSAVLAAMLALTAATASGSAVYAAEGSTEYASAEEPEDVQAFHQEQSVREEDCSLTITADAQAGVLPQNAQLKVTPLSEDARDDVQEKLEKDCSERDRDLVGFLAYDISFDADGEEIEPAGEVSVTMEWDSAAAPEDVADDDEISIQHISDDLENVDAAQVEVAEGENAVRRVELSSDSFSIFTITWTRDSSSAQRVGTVRIHTVDADGNEIEDPDTYTSTELGEVAGESGILNLKDWVKTKERDDGYGYVEARLGSVAGTAVTGFKVSAAENGSSGIYTLQYTSDSTVNSSSTWTDMADAVAETKKNNADVYLVFDKITTVVRPVRIHFMTLTGEAIEDTDGNPIVMTIDAADHTSEYDLAGTYASENAPAGYTFDTTQMNTNSTQRCQIILQTSDGIQSLGSIRGAYYRYLKYEDDIVKLARGDRKWTAVDSEDIDIYVTFKADESMTLTIHHADSDGNVIGTDAERVLTRTTTITPASDTETVPGYNRTSAGSFGGTLSGGGTEFSSITFTKSGSTWSNTYQTSSDGTAIPADLQSEVWFVYEKMTDGAPITVHYVDEEGSAIAENTYSAFNVNSGSFSNRWDGYNVGQFTTKTVEGYTYRGDYLGSTFDDAHSIPTEYRVQYYYSTSGGTWQTGIGSSASDTGTNHRAFDVYITDIYKVYTKNSNTFTVHYVDDQKRTLDGQADATFTLDSSEGNTEKDLSSGELVRDIDGKVFIGSYLGTESTSLTENTAYVTTDYLHVTKVKVGADGKNSFLADIGQTPMTLNMTRSNRWSCTTQAGRTFTLRREVTGLGDSRNVRYSLVDDQVSTSAIDLNLKSTDGQTEVYVGSSGGEKTSTVYTVTARTSTEGDTTVTAYSLSVSEWQQNDQTDIYQVYGDPSSIEKPEISVRNDLVYTGHLVVQMDPALQSALDHAGVAGTSGADISDVSYKWYKVVNGGSPTESERKQTGYTWNIAQNESERTWLDLSADDGALSTDRSSVQYYVVLTYKYKDTEYTATSDRLSMINYDELWNGGFETPAMSTNQTSNSSYYREGVWRTTGLGTGSMLNHDIEIINTTWTPSWKSAYNWNPALDFEAHGGDQFAELNCEAAGALYQDVVTQPYENLNYWLSHRARGKNADSTPEYDTMYLVIMPTKLAMTSGANGGELKEQGELESFISDHGGFATATASQPEEVVTYRDESSGILIERISSSDQAWHSIRVANGYSAMTGLTRFFFVAGPTASGSNTVGNFLDDVGFSQRLPQPEKDQFQTVVTKTFSNLDLSDIEKLAGTFRLTIHAYEDSGRTVEDSDASLQGAELSFTASADNTVSLHAKQGDTDLFGQNNGSGGSVTINDDAGTVTMTWTLLDNSISDTTYYTVEETGQDLDGYTAVTTQNGSVQQTVNNNGTETTTQTDVSTAPYVAEVSGGSILRMDFGNSYNRNSQISVQKIFSGITPTTVQELSSGYTVTLTKKNDDDTETALHLVNNEEKPYSDASLPAGVQDVSFSVRQGSGGISILLWTITGWDAGDYVVEETGYHPQGEASRYNTLASITINGVRAQEEKVSEAGAEIYVEEDVTIGGEDVPSVKEKNNSGTVNNVSSDNTALLTDTETNLLIAEYKNGDSRGYLVWTPDILGANVRQSILNYIRTKFDDDTVTLGQVSFYSSENPGVMQINDANITYDADTRTVTFNSSVNTTWERYYGTSYTLERTITENGTSVTEIVANDEPEIRIRNNYNPILKIQKVEKGHNDRTLAGAVFHIRGRSDSFTTGSDGTVAIGVLPAGTYYLEETAAPDGYNRVPDIPFNVDENGVVTLSDSSGNSVSRTEYAEVTLTDPYYTITVSDTAGTPFPDAGGFGGGIISLAYLLGLAAVAALGGWIAFRRSRKT